jgi:hypothetical protein
MDFTKAQCVSNSEFGQPSSDATPRHRRRENRLKTLTANGFYDLNGAHEKTKAIAAKEAAVLSARPIPIVQPDPFRDFMNRSPF